MPEKESEKPQDYLKPEQLSFNNSAPNVPSATTWLTVTQQPSEETPSTTSPTDLNAETTAPPSTEPSSTDNPEIPVSKSAKNPQSVFEEEQLSNNALVPTVPPETASITPNSTPASDQSATTNSQSTSSEHLLRHPKPTPSTTNNPDLNPFNPVPSEDRQDPEVNQNTTQLENTTLGILETQNMVSTVMPTTANITEEQNENQNMTDIPSTKDSPTSSALIKSTPAPVKVSPSPTKAPEKPTEPKDANQNLQDVQDFQAGKDTRGTSFHSANKSSFHFSGTRYVHHSLCIYKCLQHVKEQKVLGAPSEDHDVIKTRALTH